ncbi:MAG TPA: DUF1080 domain-containing protein, partial [Bacteroidia bacterium]|nr:DUF1080 domain-containing protein [Bacteroidia bacterium]
GKSLDGWYGWNPHTSAKLEGEKLAENLKTQRADFPNHWRVEDGELVNAGTGPYATTDEEFGDFELMLEYKTVAGADSGIYLRGNPQVQIWDLNQVFDPKKPDRRPHLGSGGLFNNPVKTLGRDPLEKVDKPFGQWNSFKIKMVGDRVWVTLNGRQVVMGARYANYFAPGEPLPAKGPLMLQTHGGEIRWRNVYVREIDEKEATSFLAANPLLPEPTHYDVAYGPHPKQTMHFWKAESTEPTPVLLFIHGGGWTAGGRLSGLSGMLPALLERGISVASVEYRFINEATADGIEPPVRGPLHDAARALQLLRSKAGEWGIDKTRIGASGGSAGACTSLWLAFHDDLADPKSDDPVARESTRLAFAAVTGAQTTLDPAQMKEWTPNSRYGAHAFGIGANAEKKTTAFDEFLARRDEILPWIAEYSPYALVSKDDSPVYLYYSAPPALGQEEKDPTHTANFGVKLQEHCEANGVKCELAYPGAPGNPAPTVLDAILGFFGKSYQQQTASR